MDKRKVNGMPLVSIVIATYRRKNKLIRALDSLVNLNYLNYEIILVDDNDDVIWNDKVEIIVRNFTDINKYIDIKYIANHPNLGSAKTRNIGIESARGEYICFLDDDDIYLPDRILNQLEPMIEVDADYSITDLALYHENDNLAELRKRDYISKISKEDLFKNHLMYHMTGTDTLMFKKTYIKEIGGFDLIDIGDEFYLMSKAILQDGKFLYVPGCDVKAYVHEAGGGLSTGTKKIDGENRLFEYKKKFFDQLDNETKRYIEMRHHAVLAFSYLKNKNLLKAVAELCKAIVVCPHSFIKLVFKHKIQANRRWDFVRRN